MKTKLIPTALMVVLCVLGNTATMSNAKCEEEQDVVSYQVFVYRGGNGWWVPQGVAKAYGGNYVAYVFSSGEMFLYEWTGVAPVSISIVKAKEGALLYIDGVGLSGYAESAGAVQYLCKVSRQIKYLCTRSFIVTKADLNGVSLVAVMGFGHAPDLGESDYISVPKLQKESYDYDEGHVEGGCVTWRISSPNDVSEMQSASRLEPVSACNVEIYEWDNDIEKALSKYLEEYHIKNLSISWYCKNRSLCLSWLSEEVVEISIGGRPGYLEPHEFPRDRFDTVGIIGGWSGDGVWQLIKSCKTLCLTAVGAWNRGPEWFRDSKSKPRHAMLIWSEISQANSACLSDCLSQAESLRIGHLTGDLGLISAPKAERMVLSDVITEKRMVCFRSSMPRLRRLDVIVRSWLRTDVLVVRAPSECDIRVYTLGRGMMLDCSPQPKIIRELPTHIPWFCTFIHDL